MTSNSPIAWRNALSDCVDFLKAGVTWNDRRDEIIAAAEAALSLPAHGEWPSREVVAREIRRAMLDNPTDNSFNKRSEKREEIANEVADVILARFAQAISAPLEGLS